MSLDQLPPPAWRAEGDGVRHLSNAVFANPVGFRPLVLDLYASAERCPVIVYVHGGGWFRGSRLRLPETVSREDFHGRILARGWAVAEVDYRLSSEASWPAPQDDVLEALHWLRFWADDLGLDPTRLALLGESAGGHLALMAAISEPAAVSAVIDWYGQSDLADTVRTRGLENPVVTMLGGPGDDLPERVAAASPLERATAQCPPVIAIHGTDDTAVPYAQSVAFTARLTELGVRNSLVTVEGAGHIFRGATDIAGIVDAGLDFVAEVWRAPRG